MDADMNAMKDKIVRWLQDKVKEAGANGVVLGLSGGIDSSVVCALARAACGESVLGVIMPIESHEDDAEHARMVADKLCVRTEHIDLEPALKTLKQSLPHGNRTADANIKPRLRMLTLYYFANLHNYLVLGTGNRTEILIGYATKHGDAGCDLLPIGCLYKRGVRELAKTMGIPDVIISKPPSAGLWPGQTDEGEIGMSYEELDSILHAIDRKQTGGIDPEKLDKVNDMIKRSEHKRQLACVCEL